MFKSPVLAILLLISAVTCRAQFVTLRLNLTLGQTYYYISTAKVAVNQSSGDVTTNVSSTITSRIAFKVIGLRDSLYDMQMTYESLNLKMNLPGNHVINYSSDKNDPNDPVSNLFGAFKGKLLKAVMTKSGNLQSVKGYDEIYTAVFAKYATADQMMIAQAKSMLEQSFGESAFKSNYNMAIPVYPAIPVKKGVLWTSDSELAGGQTANVHTVYDLRDIQESFYQIHASSIIMYPDKDKFIDNAGVLMRYNLSGNILADMVVDKTTGWVKQSTITQTISGATETKEKPKMPGLITVPALNPVSMRSEITVTDVH